MSKKKERLTENIRVSPSVHLSVILTKAKSEGEFKSLSEAIESSLKDKERLDWLADTNNHVGNVQLPKNHIKNGLEGGLRMMIDLAMEETKK